MTESFNTTRRTFMKSSAAVGGALALGSTFNTAHADGSEEIKVALVGCGGRGTKAVAEMFNTQGNVKLVSVADAFEGSCERAIRTLRQKNADKITVDADTTFTGLDAYKKAIDVDCDVVIIATPPGFKPAQFEYAVAKGKHVFCEKPVASDVAGTRRFLAAVEESKKQNLHIGIGLQRRHEEVYKNAYQMVQEGKIGDILNARVYWNGGGIWFRNRGNDQTDMQYQCNNWYHFIWSCGDQIAEQHIHNLDVACWFKGAYPVSANGMGGAERRMNGDGKQSQIFDHTFVEYTFEDGTTMHSQGRHLGSAFTRVAEIADGTKGRIWLERGRGVLENDGQRTRIPGQGNNGHQQEQTDFINALMAGELYNEGEYGAKSTFTAILGREACYSGQVVTWNDLMSYAKHDDLCPDIDNWDWQTKPPAQKNADGAYDVPKPGIYRAIVNKQDLPAGYPKANLAPNPAPNNNA